MITNHATSDHKMPPPAGSRLAWVDCARGIAIVLVVYEHALEGLKEAGLLQNVLFFNISHFLNVATSLPTFFFLAGFFAKQSCAHYGSRFVLNRLRVLLYPYVLWSVINIVIKSIMSGYVNHKVSLYALVELFYVPYDIFWFLYILFLFEVVFWALKKIDTRILLAASVLLYLINYGTQSYFTIDLLARHLPLFYLGCLLYEKCSIESITASSGSVVGIALTALVVLVAAAWLNCAGRQTFFMFEQYKDICFILYNLAGILMATSASICIARNENRSPVGKVFAFLGINSLYIYVAHTIFTAGSRIILSRVFHVQNTGIHIVAGVMLGVGCSLLLYGLSKRCGFPFLYRLRDGTGRASC